MRFCLNKVNTRSKIWRRFFNHSSLDPHKVLVQKKVGPIFFKELWNTKKYKSLLTYPKNVMKFLKRFALCQAGIRLFKVNNGKIRTMCEICSKLTIKTPKRQHDVILVYLLLTFKIFHTLFWCFHCWLWTIKCWLSNFNALKKTHNFQCGSDNWRIKIRLYFSFLQHKN